MEHSKQLNSQVVGARRAAPLIVAPDLSEVVDTALREIEGRHRANFVRAPVPMLILDAGATVTDVSDRWLRGCTQINPFLHQSFNDGPP